MNTEKIIRKHVALIHAYSMMSALQRKIVNVLLYNALLSKENNNSDVVSVNCRLSLSQLSKDIHFKSNNTLYLKQSIDDLASLKIEWNLLKDRVPTNISFLNLRVLQGSPTFYQDGTFHFSFHNVMLDLLKNPSIYGTIDLETQSKFDSKYGHSLYENASRLVNLQKEKTIDLDIFRKLFSIPEEKYASMRELSRNVISPAVEEVNDLANFTVAIEPVKSKNKIIAFKLQANSKNKITKFHLKASYDNERGKVMEAIDLAFGNMNRNIMNTILEQYSDDYILEKIDYVKSHAKKTHANLYPVAYFISALKNNYQTTEKTVDVEKNKISPNEKLLNDWTHEFMLLRGDLLHWKKQLSMESTDEKRQKDIAMIVVDCENKLQSHLDRKPILNNINTDV